MHIGIENFTLNIPIKASHSSAGKFINAMMNTPCSWLEISNHLIPFPRCSWITACMNGENLSCNPIAKVEDKSLLAGFSF
jgi:hypothetical protein